MNWKYLACFIDADGSICINDKPRLSASQTSRKVLEELQSFTGAGGIYAYGGKKPGHSAAWSWCVTKKADILRILEGIRPHLIVKRRQADLLAAACYSPELSRQIKPYLQELNAKGPKWAPRRVKVVS